jgi:energy-coupling factor transport system permease protein
MLTKADALSTFIWVVGCSIAMLVFSSPVSGGIMTAALLLLLIVSRDVPIARVARRLPLILLVPTCLLFFHAVSHAGHIVLDLGPVSVTREGLREGLLLFFRVAFVVLASLTFLWTTDIRELMVGLVRIGMPYRFAFAIYLALRYVPIMQVERDIIRDAIAVRCQSRRVGLKWRLRLWVRYIFLLVVNGLRKGEQTAAAMKVRGFGVQRHRTFITPFRLTFNGAALIIGSAVVVSVLFWLFG